MLVCYCRAVTNAALKHDCFSLVFLYPALSTLWLPI